MIEAVLFDLDGTLLDRDASLAAFVRDQHRRLHRWLGHIPEDTYLERFVALDRRGHVWKDEVYRRLIAEFAIRHVGWEALLEDFLAQFSRHCVPFPNLHATLEGLAAASLKLGIITNGRGDLQMASIRALGIEDAFAAITISETAGVRKPERSIFDQTVARLDVEPCHAVFVGDHPESDVAGARQAGLRAIWKRDPGWPEPPDADAVVDDLAELPDLVARLADELTAGDRAG